jgi:flagellar hook-basal body complex protein FliE
MTGAEIAALGWVASFINTALGALSDRLKKPESTARAREYAFGLYESLATLRSRSGSFVEALHAVADGTPGAEEALGQALRDVSRALKSVETALHRLDPQLEVHVPDTAEEVHDAQMSRALVVSRTEESLQALARGEGDVDVAAIVADAERAQQQIEAATESVRAFLSEQFSFRESFG